MMPFTYIIIFFATLAGCAETTSNTTLQLPITITPLLQDGIQRGNITKFVHQIHPTFFQHVTFSDIVKSLGHVSHVQLDKTFEGIMTLALASMGHGLTVDKFEFINGSKWTIVMSAEELASVSNITFPLDDKIRLVTIQKAMYKILENRFNFKTEEIAERLNTTKEKVYAFLEPGWIQVVNFITEKNILALSTNYTIPPFYIAEALNMTLSELYNSILPQLDDILVNKIDVIRVAAERWRRIVASSIAKLSRVPSTSTMNSTITSTRASTTTLINTTTSPVMADMTKTTAIQTKSVVIHTKTSTSSILNKMSSRQEISHTPATTLNIPSDTRPINVLQNSSMLITSPPTTGGIQNTLMSTTLPEIKKSTALSDKSFTSMYHAPSFAISTSIPQSSWSSASSYAYIQTSTAQHHSLMLQSTAKESVSSTKAEMFSAITSKPSTASRNIAEILTSISSRNHSQKTSEDIKSRPASDARTSEIFVTQIVVTSSPITTHIIPTSLLVSSYSSIRDNLSKTQSKTGPTASLGKVTSDMTTIDAIESSSIAKMKSASIAMASSSKMGTKASIPHRTSQMTESTQRLLKSTKSSLSPSYPRETSTNTKDQQSTNILERSPAFTTTSTNTKYQQSTNILERSSAFTTSADGVTWKTSSPVNLNSYHASSSHFEDIARSSISYTQSISITTGNTLETDEDGDEVDPVVLIMVPIMCVLFLVAVAVALIMWIRNRRQRHKSANQMNAESGSELSSKGLVGSTESINNRTTGFVNKGGDDRSSRSMSRSSSISNLETIQEGKEPDEPEIYHL
ncbi:location of vulva defective 1-like [Dendronephthya gigantea]|uniref:location of vulva defective 1-like n=1 Tax=Dendronephthya gigantea TaxID=151771 RepID=UPI00106BD4AC|nr:location of vulva defective 1-like [Dendronephthya gigantea]